MYVAIEGIDTSGKSTQIELLRQHYRGALFTREPGSTPLGEHLRELLLHGELQSSRAELFLFLADRAEHAYAHLQHRQDRLIISDRSLISGIAYATEFPIPFLCDLNRFALDDQLPDLVILLSLTEETLLQRLNSKPLDRIEQQPTQTHLTIQSRMQEALSHLSIPHQIIDANLSPDVIHQKILQHIT